MPEVCPAHPTDPSQTPMTNPKRAIRVLNGTGGAFTSAKRAKVFVDRGRARRIDQHTIEMIETDYRHLSAVRSIEQPRTVAATSPTPIRVYEYDGPENLRTFARYPDSQQAFQRAA